MLPQQIRSPIDVVIVDPNDRDYQGLVAAADRVAITLRTVRSGHQALQLATRRPASMWLSNIELSDMSGLELLSLVKQRRPSTLFYLISNSYSAEDELRARAAGAAGYLSKPVNDFWLQLCRTSISRVAIRAGPAHAPS